MSTKLDEFLLDISTKYTNGYTTKELCKIYKCSKDTIHKLFNEHGIKFRQYRKYSLDEEFFNVIDSEAKAYFLGLLYADGYNNTDFNAVSLQLKESDKHILDYFTQLLQPSKPLMFQKGRGPNDSNNYRMVINSPVISNRLAALGCPKKKTFITSFPSSDQIPKELLHHFVRGYFDGDGSVNNGKKFHFSIVGTIEFLNGLQNLLREDLNFGISQLSQRHLERDNNIRSLHKSGRKQTIKFGDWLYKDANVFLIRKKLVFDSYAY